MTAAPAALAAERAWQRLQHATRRAALWGVLLGGLFGLVLFAPASWLASAVHRASGERVLLADARGSVWAGDAVLVLAGGPGSRDASALPGRVQWRLRPHWRGLLLKTRQPCCLHEPLRLELRPAWGGFTLVLPPRPEGIGRWPARWLAGLGTPWNTLQLGGTLQLASTGFTLRMVEGRARLDGTLELQLIGASSTLVPVDPLGSYRLQLRGDAAGGDAATLTLQTLDGALQLAGSGQWTGARLRFRGDARAAPGQENALANLLNIIGKRQGALSVISIG